MRALFFGLSVVLASHGSIADRQSEAQDRPSFEAPARYTVALTREGVLEGWAGYVDASTGEFLGAEGALVSLVRQGDVVRQVGAGKYGYFEVEGIAPGVYAVTVADERGFSASAFHVVAPQRDAAYLSMVCTMVAHEDSGRVSPHDDVAATTGPCGDVVNGAGGTAPAGGGSGGGGFGSLIGYGLGAVGLGFGIAELTDDDNRRRPVASPVLP